MNPIGLICAMPQELEAFGDSLTLLRTNKYSEKVTFQEAMLEGKHIVYPICEEGVGKISAAALTASLKCLYNISTIIFSGVAGGMDPELNPGDIVIADQIINYDYGHYQNGKITTYRSGKLFIIASQDDVPLAFTTSEKSRNITQQVIQEFSGELFQNRKTRLVSGTILTGDVFLNDANRRDELHKQFKGQAIEMEGGAVMQVADLLGIEDTFVIRALSDRAGDESHTDFSELLHHAAPMAAGITKKILRLL